MMSNKPTNIRMPERTYEQLRQLEEWGYGNTKAAIIMLAIERLYEQELARRSAAVRLSPELDTPIDRE
jgi:predicted DNA-binding protein